MPYLTLDNHRIFYTQKRGNPGFPAVVLVHGAGSSHLGWPALLRRLPDYPVYAVDLPGHGRSSFPGFNDITAYADVLAAFINKLDLQRVVVIGHSMGGAITQMLAIRHSHLAGGLVLVGTGARLPVSEVILDQTRTDLDAVIEFITRYAWARGTPAHLLEANRKMLLETGAETLHSDYVACNTFNVIDRLPQITIPTLVIVGSIDKMTPPHFSQFLANHIANAELVAIEDAGHMVILEKPELVTAVIAKFLKTHFPLAH